jgi:hypothetical protein
MLKNQNLNNARSIAIAAKTNGTANGTGVDTAGYESITVVLEVGTRTDGTHAAKVQDSSDNSTFADVVAAELVGVFAADVTTNVNQQVAYIGQKRYVRAVLTTSGATTGAIVGASVIRGHAIQNDG